MDSIKIPEMFQSKIRLAIITALISGEKSFKALKQITEATDGNLSTHLAKLEEAEYISCKKEFVGKKPSTTYSLKEKGRKEFTAYVDLLYNAVHSDEE
ncbi:MAG: transcriptional regulator [Clostridia bacterium]|nr:transcriptional regulator [Clostridia bacterium]